MAAELGSLRAELKSAGVFETRELRSWLKIAFLGACLAGCLWGIAATGVLGALVLVPVAAVFATALAMFGHEGSHKSFSSSPTRNTLVTNLMFPLFSGLGALYWHHKHDRLHHGHPNVEGKDPDIKPWPFASTKKDHETSPKAQQWFQRNQKYLFWPMSLLMSIGMRRSSILYLAHEKKRTRAWWIESAMLFAHYVCWAVIPSIIWGPVAGLGVYLAMWAFVGTFLALIFAPAHIGLPVLHDQNHDWLHQIETTRNLELPRVISFFFIGLDYQVEHHVFPKIPHMTLPRAAAITADWCKRNDVPYQSTPYLAALGDAARFLQDAWQRDAVSPQSVRQLLLDAI
jgi:fatty acid desaturase